MTIRNDARMGLNGCVMAKRGDAQFDGEGGGGASSMIGGSAVRAACFDR